MITEFYKKALPSQGVYCVATIDTSVDKRVKHKFVESIDEIEPLIETYNNKKLNVFVALNSFSAYSRKADEAIFARSFFVDLDVGENKDYQSKQEALDALDKFLSETWVPQPTVVDSGGGIHAYWFFDRDLDITEWKPNAERFKELCLSNGLKIDPVVTADAARILRSPGSFNHKSDPPSRTYIYRGEDLPVYSFDDVFKVELGNIDVSVNSLLANVPKGLSDDQRRMMGLDNYEYDFSDIADKSVKGQGCGQIKFILENAKTITEPVWRAGLSIAQHCKDRDVAIHAMSEDHPSYNKDATEQKANATQGMPQSCETFNNTNPGICDTCQHKGKIKPANPLAFGKLFKIAEIKEPEVQQPTEEINNVNKLFETLNIKPEEVIPVQEVVRETQKQEVVSHTTRFVMDPNNVVLPRELYPYVRGQAGGIYIVPTAKFDKDGAAKQDDPILLTDQDVYPLRRMFSTFDGECLEMKIVMPNDDDRDIILPMKYVYAQDKFKEVMSSSGVYFNPAGVTMFMQYIIKWGQYLRDRNKAEIMRTQMGWTPKRESFVIGDKEITRNGDVISAPTSPLCRGIAKHLTQAGDFDTWKKSANKLNKDSLEVHAFVLLSGFGSVLMDYTSTSGVTICLTGESGAAKTGALYSNLSIWGNPKDLSVLDATENGLTGRFLGLHNIPFGLDEVGNILPKTLSQLIHKISQGKAKIRMQASVNAEREHEISASLVAVFTSNHSLYDKLSMFKKDPNGEVARLIEISARKPTAFKDDASLGREIFDKFRSNYGWAGPAFIQALYGYNDADILGLIEKWTLRFKKDFGEDTAYRFYENLVAASMTAGDIAVGAGIVDYNLDKIYGTIVGEMINIRDNVVKVNRIDYESLIGEFINTNQTGILAIKDGKVSMEPRSALVIRAEVDSSTIYIAKPAFRKFLSEAQVSSREFVFQLTQAGIDVKESKKRLGSGWKDATGAINVEAYIFDTKHFSDGTFKVINDAAH
jgi:hypothetical protein